MKKFLILSLALFVTFGMISCSQSVSNEKETNNVEQQEEQNSQAPSSNPIKDTGDTDAPHTNDPGDTDTPHTDDPDGIDTAPIGCAIHHTFRSAKDLNTYITTGSQNKEDYLFEPITPLEDMPDAKRIQAYGYHSIYEFFSFDETTFDHVEASFSFTDSGSIIYNYFFDHIRVTIQPAESNNLLECYNNLSQGNLTKEDIIPYTKDHTDTDGFMLRENTNCDVQYYMVQGTKKVAYFVVNGSYVTINGTLHSDDTSSLPKDFNQFMADKNTASFSAFFSDDDHVFNEATAKVATIK